MVEVIDKVSDVSFEELMTTGPTARLADFAVVANRLPVRPASARNEEGWSPSPGGLVSALMSVLHKHDGLWIGWPGTSEDVDVPEEFDGIRLQPVAVSADEYETFYLGFSNATLWPLYHDAIRPPTFHRAWWHAYRERQPALRRRGRRGGRAPAPPCGSTTTNCSSSPRCCASCAPTCASGSSCTSRSRPRSCSCSCRGDARSSTACSAPTSWASRSPRPRRTSRALARRRARAPRAPTRGSTSTVARVRVGAFPISVDCEQIVDSLQRRPAVRAAGQGDPPGPRRPRVSSCSASTASTTPRASSSGIKAVAELLRRRLARAPGATSWSRSRCPSRETDAHYERERHDLEQIVERGQRRARVLGTPVDPLPPPEPPLRRAPRAVRRGRRHAGYPVPRRHEPRRQGVRDVSHGPDGTPGPERVRRRRDASCAAPTS